MKLDAKKFPTLQKILADFDPGVQHYSPEELGKVTELSDVNRLYDDARLSAEAGVEQMIEILKAKRDLIMKDPDAVLKDLLVAHELIHKH